MAEEAEPIRVSVEEAKRRVDAGEGVLLDVVDTPVYEDLSEIAEGAIRIDPERVPDDYDRVPRNKAVFAY